MIFNEGTNKRVLFVFKRPVPTQAVMLSLLFMDPVSELVPNEPEEGSAAGGGRMDTWFTG